VPKQGLPCGRTGQHQRLENPTGFPLKASHQLAYNRWLAAEAHKRGLSIGLKNDLPHVQALLPHYDWALVESCFTYSECGLIRPFVRAGKAVWVIEYKGGSAEQVNLWRDRFCPEASELRVQLLFKSRNLDGRLPARCGRVGS
jgi:hypothetical protein